MRFFLLMDQLLLMVYVVDLFLYITHYFAIVGSDDDSDFDEQARKEQADLAAFRAQQEKAKAAKIKKKEYARQ